MLKNTLLQQKNEKESLINQSYVLRHQLLSAKKLLDTDLIKVITGPRRAGKSIFSLLLLKDRDFAYVNFDDENLMGLSNYDEIVSTIAEVYPDCKLIYFDEIQNLPKWEVFVNKLKRRGYNLVLTGSNANLLSSELASALTGRYAAIEILPFSFSEYLTVKKIECAKGEVILPEAKGKILSLLGDYLKNGGFPEVAVKNFEAKPYLTTLVDAIMFKDVVKRHGVRYSVKISDLFSYLVAHFGSEFSFTKIGKTLGFRSTVTVENYLSYLEDAYLVFCLNRFSFKMKEQLKAPKKAYFVDNGLISAKAFQFSQNTGKLMENAVFIQLLRKGYLPNISLFYYKTRNKREVDFIVKEGLNVTELIQVCFDVTEPEVKSRELKALIEAAAELKCSKARIITWDFESQEKNGLTVDFIPLWKWLIS